MEGMTACKKHEIIVQNHGIGLIKNELHIKKNTSNELELL
jgi:hypothetical protein